MLCRRALPTRRLVPWRASIPSHRRWYIPRSSRTVLLGDRVHDDFLLNLTSSSLPKIEKYDCPLFVILSTPTQASRFTSSSGPTPLLQNLVSRVFRKSLKHKFGATLHNVRVLSATVDALPASVPGKAAEGFAYAVLHATNGKSNSIFTLADDADQHEYGTLEFQLSDDWFRMLSHQKYEHVQNAKAIAETDYFVAMKLANTLFQSGRKKTMLDATYAVDPAGDLYAVRHEWLAHCSIMYDSPGRKFVKSVDERAVKTDKLFDVSLVPLTEPRKISVSLGNILRTIDLPDGSSRPASHELEANLDAYFKATEQEPHARPVWALLMNQSGVERTKILLQNAQFLASLSDETGQLGGLGAIWAGSDKGTIGSLRETIYLDGSRLQRVLSGGGGWGDKAGLLALDPQDSLRPKDASNQEISQFTSDLNEFTHVQFFTPTNSTSSPLTEFPRGLWMGTIPDGLEMYQPPTGGGVEVYANTFGALSSGGMSLRTNTVVYENLTDERSNQVTQTKIDVPFASFTNTLPEHANTTSGNAAQAVAKDLLQRVGPKTLAEGTALLRVAVDSIWSTVRTASLQLHKRAGVNLVQRRREIKPLLNCLVRVKQDVNPGGTGLLAAGIIRFNQTVESDGLSEVRRASAAVAQQLRMGDDFIDRVVSQIGKAVRNSNDDAREAASFNMAARQKRIIEIYDRLIPIVRTIRPKLVANHVDAKYRTLRNIWGFRLHYIHNEWMAAHYFIGGAERTIDEIKARRNDPNMVGKSRPEAQTRAVAGWLQKMLDNAMLSSRHNLSDMKHGVAKPRHWVFPGDEEKKE
ncbi:hypothetical protein HDK90DRAFT_490342 [Phyllosticta capitalensis]|uniref:Uncharacterized protein n=1 Tax=Phyllosticta capitalensis TaxID=121624 RepID=A0ABR1YLL7_9PEZI